MSETAFSVQCLYLRGKSCAVDSRRFMRDNRPNKLKVDYGFCQTNRFISSPQLPRHRHGLDCFERPQRETLPQLLRT